MVDSEILYQIRKAQHMERRMLKPEVRPPITHERAYRIPILCAMVLVMMTSYMLGRSSIEYPPQPPPDGAVCVSEEPAVDEYAVQSEAVWADVVEPVVLNLPRTRSSGANTYSRVELTQPGWRLSVANRIQEASYTIVGCTNASMIDFARAVAHSGDLFVVPDCPVNGIPIKRVFVHGLQVWPALPAEYSDWVKVGRFELRVPR